MTVFLLAEPLPLQGPNVGCQIAGEEQPDAQSSCALFARQPTGNGIGCADPPLKELIEEPYPVGFRIEFECQQLLKYLFRQLECPA